MITVYNSLSKRKEEFVALKKGVVTMYVCGVTPYDYAHLGHARAAVVFDNVRRFLECEGYAVKHLTNFTDVDDKIINRANEEKKSCGEVTKFFINDYKSAMKKLNVLEPFEYACATQHIEEIIELIEKLEKKGFAYRANGDVYFDVSEFAEYGKLSGITVEQLVAGARVEPGEHKKSPEDFALWKASKPGEPVWESPFGQGRPGWHVECSAMVRKHLGDTIDIHGGGSDLVFPHHENEIAQSEAASGKPLARYWIHCGLLQAGEEKMSKSLKNFFSLKDALKKHEPETIRLFLATAPYRQPLKYLPQSLEESEEALKRLNNCRAALQEAIAQKEFGKEKIGKEVAGKEKQFVDAMRDDFNTSNALAALFELSRAINSKIGTINEKDCKHALETLEKLGRLLGIFFAPATKKLPKGVEKAWLEKQISEREKAREEKDYEKSDAIRKAVAAKGVLLEDTAKGTRWRTE